MDAWFPWFAGVTLLVQIWIVFTINAGVDSIGGSLQNFERDVHELLRRAPPAHMLPSDLPFPAIR